MTRRRTLLVCQDCRDPAGKDGRGARSGVPAALRQRIAELGLEARVELRPCFAICGYGVNLRVDPDRIWYGCVTAADAPGLVDEHLAADRPVERFRIDVDPLTDEAAD